MATETMWNWQSSCTKCVFCIEVDAGLKMSILRHAYPYTNLQAFYTCCVAGLI